DNYAGLGLNRGLAVGLRSHLASLDGFGDAITNVGVRLDLAQSTLGRLGEIAHGVKSSALQSGGSIDSSGQTQSQLTAYSELGEILGLLNTQAGDRHLFSGRASDQPAVESIDRIMNGDGARAGLKQVIAERNQADLGAGSLGRLVISAPTALTAAVGKLAGTSLSAASAVAAAGDFFADPPQRVAGPPFDTATALVPGTQSDTLSWYTGETGADPARATATARIDSSITVS